MFGNDETFAMIFCNITDSPKQKSHRSAFNRRRSDYFRVISTIEKSVQSINDLVTHIPTTSSQQWPSMHGSLLRFANATDAAVKSRSAAVIGWSNGIDVTRSSVK
jgi:hypothetical protein